MKWLTKKIILLGFFACILISLLAQSVYGLTCPSSSNYYSYCFVFFAILINVGVQGVSLLLPVLFTLPFNERVFIMWRRVMLGFLPLLIGIVYILSGATGDGYLGDYGFGAILLLVPIGIYYLVSLFVIGITAWRTRISH